MHVAQDPAAGNARSPATAHDLAVNEAYAASHLANARRAAAEVATLDAEALAQQAAAAERAARAGMWVMFGLAALMVASAVRSLVAAMVAG